MQSLETKKDKGLETCLVTKSRDSITDVDDSANKQMLYKPWKT